MGSLQLPFSRVGDRRFAIVDAKRVAAGRRTYAAGAIWENRKRVPMGLRKRLCWSVPGAGEGGGTIGRERQLKGKRVFAVVGAVMKQNRPE